MFDDFGQYWSGFSLQGFCLLHSSAPCVYDHVTNMHNFLDFELVWTRLHQTKDFKFAWKGQIYDLHWKNGTKSHSEQRPNKATYFYFRFWEKVSRKKSVFSKLELLCHCCLSDSRWSEVFVRLCPDSLWSGVFSFTFKSSDVKHNLSHLFRCSFSFNVCSNRLKSRANAGIIFSFTDV